MRDSLAQGRYFLTTILPPLLVGLEARHAVLEPAPGLKTAGWLLGHLAVTGDFGRRLCGSEAALCPREWRARFGPGTHPVPDAALYPPLAELAATVPRVYASLLEAAGAAPATVLASPNPYEPARTSFPTAGDFVAYLVSGHFGYHLGQLALWRAAAGLPARGAP